jgi:uncharacterized protein (TIGR03086 family)
MEVSMDRDLLDLYDCASAWATEKVAGATDDLDAQTPCEQWDVRTLLNHMLETQRYFLNSARGEEASPPGPEPSPTLSADPVQDFQTVRREMVGAFSGHGVVEKTGPALGVAFTDILVHSWDVARACGQPETMPDGLAEAGYEMVHGKFTAEQRKGIFKPEISVAQDASAQDRLLAYTGRDPR